MTKTTKSDLTFWANINQPAPKRATRGPKYGIKFSTIRYWTARARDLSHYRGLKAVGCLEQPAHQIANIDARTIGHDAIMTAAVHSAQEVRNLLDTGATWNARPEVDRRCSGCGDIIGNPAAHQACSYRVQDGIIVSAGKFEAEPEYVPVFWDVVLNSCEDETIDDDGREVSIVLVTDEDRARWPELRDVHAVAMVESDQGFVSSDAMTATRLDEYRAGCERDFDARAAEDEANAGPQEDDLTTTDHITFWWHGQNRVAFVLREQPDLTFIVDASPRRYVAGKFATVERAIRAFQQAEQYWPNVWAISDHGNAVLIDLGRA